MAEDSQQLIDVEMLFDAQKLDAPEKGFLRALLEASELMDRAFRSQMGLAPGGYPGEDTRPAFYPSDLTREEFEDYLAKHPEEREPLVSPYTVIRRQGGRLVAVPYNVEYGEFMIPASDALRRAAGLTANPYLKLFLTSRAQSLLSDDYYQSDIDWINLQDNDWDITIGPYEVYRDSLLGLKAAYMAVIERVDAKESKNLEVYLKFLALLEEALPYPPEQKPQEVKLHTAFAVVRDVYRGGDILYGYQAVAQNLPNDPRVLSKYGSKKTFYMNMMDIKAERLSKPLVRELIAEDQGSLFNTRSHFLGILFHEIAHALGPRYARRNGQNLPLNEALKDRHSAFEEGKADVVGFFSEGFLVQKGVFTKNDTPSQAVAYLASKLRTMRFGTKEAHGLGAYCQLNHHLKTGAISFDENTGRFRVDPARLPASVSALAERMLGLQAAGDYEGVGAFYQELGQATPPIQQALLKAAHLPVDVKPTYRILW